MNTLVGLGIACLLLCDVSTAQRSSSEFPKLTGPFLGQKPPGTTPEIFAPGVVSREGNQHKLNISPDYREIIFSEGSAQNNSASIIRMIREKEYRGEPDIFRFSREYVSNEPSLSPDGKKLFFVSNRPMKKDDKPGNTPDIWYIEKVEGRWSDPHNLGTPVNSNGVEVQPFLGADNQFYFCRLPAEIYCSRIIDGKFQEPTKLSEKINQGRVSGPCPSPDASYLIFHSKNEGGLGGWDLSISFKDDSGNWMEAGNMGNVINTPGDEGDATISPDGKYIFFSRDGDIYWVSAKIIEGLRPKHRGE